MVGVQLPEWAEVLFDESARYVALVGGRGSGKSRSVASALVLRAAQKPLRILCAREIQKSIKDSVKRLLDDEIERTGLAGFFTSTDTEIRGANGSLMLFAGLRTNIDSIKSMEGIDVCWVEEAQTVSQASLDVLIPTVRKPGSQLVFSWNPKAATDPVDAMFCGATVPPRSIVRRVNHTDNPWFPDVLRAELEYDRKRDPDKYRHVWEGEYLRNSERRVFRNWRVEEFEAPADAVLRFGADWGFATDPTVLVRCYVVGRELFVDHEAYGVGCEIVDTPALFLTVPQSERWPIVADSARPETISHMRRNGFPKIMAAVKGPKSLEEGVEWLKSHDLVVHPRCVHLIDELTLYSYKADPLTGAVLPVLEDRDNHLIDALRYACEGARRTAAAKPVAPLNIGSMASGWSR
jgi:phage terminase large subunit